MLKLGISFGFAFLPLLGAGAEVSFNEVVRPILSDRCFHCHGPDEHDRKGKLRLDQFEGQEGAYRELKGSIGIKPGNLEKSEVWQRIITEDQDDVMPPSDSHKKALTHEEREVIKQWILEGAKYEKYWAFEVPVKKALPQLKNNSWAVDPIDAYVLNKVTQKGLEVSKQASKRTLIRRLSFDLTGLPPSLDEIQSFVENKSDKAYEELINYYMSKPQYGEHMAKYWLDLVRFADTNGKHHDHYRELSPYRDWVIRAFNKNLSYADFVKYQLAGDLYAEPSEEQLIASGFNRLHMIIDGGTMLSEESYTNNVIDRVTAVGTAFMGLTVQCAVCHDHKYDPITQKEFFSLFAFFNNIDARPETGRRNTNDFYLGLQKPYISLGKEAQHKELEAKEGELHKINHEISKAQKALKNLSKSKDENSEQKPEKDALTKSLESLKKEKKKIEEGILNIRKGIPYAMIMKERKDIKPAYVLNRGVYDNFGEKVERLTPAFLPPMKTNSELKTRMNLATWFVDRENPLTSKVTVNRFWQQIFGTGLVKTSEDFGAQGEVPSHPDLLNYLALKFMESGWDIKALMKEILMSKAYQQSSVATQKKLKLDPENRYLSRGPRFRMDSEMIRDQILATSGLINLEMYGKSVKPPQPAGIWKAVTMPYSYPKVFEADQGPKIYRRSIYSFWKRGMPPPQMSIFNAPTRESCTTRRERTNTPLQALLLLNESEYMKAARALARGVLNGENKTDLPRMIRECYEVVTSQKLDDVELNQFNRLLNDLLEMYKQEPTLAKEMCEGLSLKETESEIELSAMTVLVNTIYNLDITKTKE